MTGVLASTASTRAAMRSDGSFAEAAATAKKEESRTIDRRIAGPSETSGDDKRKNAPQRSDRMAPDCADDRKAPHAPHDVGEVLPVPDLDREEQDRRDAVAFLVLDVLDVRAGVGDRGRDLREHAGLVRDLDAKLHLVVAADADVPGDIDDALGILQELGHVRAFDAVYDDALDRKSVV